MLQEFIKSNLLFSFSCDFFQAQLCHNSNGTKILLRLRQECQFIMSRPQTNNDPLCLRPGVTVEETWQGTGTLRHHCQLQGPVQDWLHCYWQTSAPITTNLVNRTLAPQTPNTNHIIWISFLSAENVKNYHLQVDESLKILFLISFSSDSGWGLWLCNFNF